MTPEQVELSRAAGQVSGLLTIDARLRLIDAVTRATSIDKVRQPYRSWLRDPLTIPDGDRRRMPDSPPQ